MAATISGRVVDGQTKEPLPGVRVTFVGTGKGAISGLDGTFRVKGITEAHSSLKFTYAGYRDTILQFETVADADLSGIEVGLARYVSKEQEVIVTGTVEHGSDASSVLAIRNADNLINSVSARTIEVSPDISVADVSNRISGVSMSRTAATGDAQYAIIRGMDKRYNYTTINGIKIPSPDNKNRYVPLDIFPSELVERVEVTKTLLPSMEGDAIGGAMNLVMKQAPDHGSVSVQAGTGYDGLFANGQKFYSFTPDASSQSPRALNGDSYIAKPSDFPSGTWIPKQVSFLPGEYLSASVGDRFLDDKLGIVAAGSFQNSFRGASTLFWLTDVNQTTNTPILTNFQFRNYSTLQTRTGGLTNIDYRADEDNTLQLFGMYASLSKMEMREMFDTLNGKGSWPKNDDVTHSYRSTNENQGIGNVTLSGVDKIFGKDLEADWHLAYSTATLSEPDQATLSVTEKVIYGSDGIGTIPLTQVHDGSRTWTSSSDQDRSAYLTLKSTEDLFGAPVEFSYGGMYRSKIRSATYDQYQIVPNDYASIQTYNGDIRRDTLTILNPGGSGKNALNYDAHENTAAWFGQAKFSIGNLLIIGGLRGERTDFGWSSALPITQAGQTGSVLWSDSGLPFFFLPSISLKYAATENQNLRLSYFRSVSRPNFYEVVPNAGIPGDDYKEVSSDSLRPTTANNIDARWEYFPGGLDQILVGAFYKQLHNPIEYIVQYILVDLQYGPANLGNATNYGFELDFRKYFSDFGISGNYTYTNSSITTPKVEKHNFVSDTTSQTRPLQGQSAHIGNLSFLYKNFELGTNAQIGAVYTGPAIVAVSAYKDNDIWSKGFLQLDFSGEQKLTGNLALYLKVTNILNSAREEVIHQPYQNSAYPQPVNSQVEGQDVLVRRELYDRNYILGLRLKM